MKTDNKFIAIFTIVAGSIVAYLMFGHSQSKTIDVTFLPSINALLNSITTLLLIGAFISIKRKNKQLHKRLMITAMISSTLFLICYLTYHFYSPGPKLYEGQWVAIYRFILFSHIIWAALILPFILKSFLLGIRNKPTKHKQFVKFTFPIWLYVSLTGVVIYIMLYL